jgi:uncharacterized protein YbjT (DUF2867 family)
MRVVVVGGSGRTGKLIVEQLIKAGHETVATIRNPKHMAMTVKLGAETVVLDLEHSTGPDFAAQFKGADAVVFAAGSAEADENSDIDRTGTLKTVRAAKKAGAMRYISVSALGATTPTPDKWLDSELMKNYYKAKKAANKHVRDSGLDWTIIEPGGLTDGKLTGKVTLAQDGVPPDKISRADVAATVLAALATPASKGHTFQVVGGKTAVLEAVASESKKPAPDLKPTKRVEAKKAPAKKAEAKKPPAKKPPAKKAVAKK